MAFIQVMICREETHDYREWENTITTSEEMKS